MNHLKIAPFGSWKSIITSDFVVKETVEKIQGYLPGKKQAMFAPIPEDQALSKSEILPISIQ